MRKLILLATSFAICGAVSGQVADHDAIELRLYLKEIPPASGQYKFSKKSDDDLDGFIRILKKYVEKSARDTINTANDLFKYFDHQENPFLKDFLPENAGAILDDSSPDLPANKALNLSSFENLNGCA